MSATANAALARPWNDLWDGDLSIADDVIAEDFVAHAAPLTGVGPDEVRGREALKQWIGGIHSVLRDLKFTVQVGPIADDDHFVARWIAHGTYGGGFPGLPEDAAGKKITFTGTDILRVVDGKLVEYWANADSLLFMQQLGVSTVPGAAPSS
jgi:predicted ester cyclase